MTCDAAVFACRDVICRQGWHPWTVWACLLGCWPFNVPAACEHYYLCLQVVKLEAFSIMRPVLRGAQHENKTSAVAAEEVAARRLEGETPRKIDLTRFEQAEAAGVGKSRPIRL